MYADMSTPFCLLLKENRFPLLGYWVFQKKTKISREPMKTYEFFHDGLRHENPFLVRRQGIVRLDGYTSNMTTYEMKINQWFNSCRA